MQPAYMRTPFKTTDNIAEKAKGIRLTPIIEDFRDMQLQSSLKKSKDDSDRKVEVSSLLESDERRILDTDTEPTRR